MAHVDDGAAAYTRLAAARHRASHAHPIALGNATPTRDLLPAQSRSSLTDPASPGTLSARRLG